MTFMVLAHRLDDVFLGKARETLPKAPRRHCIYASTTVSILIARNSLLADVKEAANDAAFVQPRHASRPILYLSNYL